MKRKYYYLLIFMIIMLSALLVGCGDKGASPEDVEEDKGATTQEVVEDHTNEEVNRGTRMYTDVTGQEVEIPVEPKRVITTQYLDAMLALGVKPVAVPSHVLDNEYLGELQEGVADLGHPFGIEKIIELEPDLIIASQPEEVEQLSKVAPTVLVPWMHGDVFAQLTEIATVLGKEEQAKEWIANLEDKAAEGREAIKGKVGEDEVVTIFMTWGKDTLRIYGARNVGHMIYRSLDLTPPPFIQERLEKDLEYSEFVYENISMEMLPEFAGDRIIMVNYGDETKAEGGMFYQLENSSLWKNLEAVKNNKVYYVNEDPWFAYSPIAIEKSLKEAINIFSE